MVFFLVRLARQYEREERQLEVDVPKAVRRRPSGAGSWCWCSSTASTSPPRGRCSSAARCIPTSCAPSTSCSTSTRPQDLTEQWRAHGLANMELELVDCPDRRLTRVGRGRRGARRRGRDVGGVRAAARPPVPRGVAPDPARPDRRRPRPGVVPPPARDGHDGPVQHEAPRGRRRRRAGRGRSGPGRPRRPLGERPQARRRDACHRRRHRGHHGPPACRRPGTGAVDPHESDRREPGAPVRTGGRDGDGLHRVPRTTRRSPG